MRDVACSKWVANVNEKVDTSAVCTKVRGYPVYLGNGRAGSLNIYHARDDAGNVLILRASKDLGFDQGDRVTFKGTVRAKSVYNGIQQTEIFKVKVTGIVRKGELEAMVTHADSVLDHEEDSPSPSP
jgi:hypothetical protein